MSTYELHSEDIAEMRRAERQRYLLSFVVSIVVHILLLVIVALLSVAPDIEKPPEELLVPITFADPPPQPVPEPVPQPQPEVPEPQPQPQQPRRPPPPDDASLLAFRSSEGEIEARPLRPQGPEAEVKAPPKPEEAEEGRPTPEPVDSKDAQREVLTESDEQELRESEPERVDSPDPAAREEPEPLRERPDPNARAPREPAREEPDAPRAADEPLPFPPVPQERRPSRPSAPRRNDSPRRAPDLDFTTSGGLWADNIKFESTDYDWSDYSTKLYFAIYRAWLRELYGRVRRFERDQAFHGLPRLDAEVTIQFVIERDGGVSALTIIDPAIVPTLDEASVASIERAVIPPLPADFPRNQERLAFRFRIGGFESAQQLERRLRMSQALGEF